jgi:hypothetical protein
VHLDNKRYAPHAKSGHIIGGQDTSRITQHDSERNADLQPRHPRGLPIARRCAKQRTDVEPLKRLVTQDNTVIPNSSTQTGAYTVIKARVIPMPVEKQRQLLSDSTGWWCGGEAGKKEKCAHIPKRQSNKPQIHGDKPNKITQMPFKKQEPAKIFLVSYV